MQMFSLVSLFANILTQETMLKSMKKNPIVFAMANPDPEISYESAVRKLERI